MTDEYSAPMAASPLYFPPYYLYSPPGNVAWSDIDPSFSPGLGQSIDIRESFRFTCTGNGEATVYRNENRFLSTTDLGHWQELDYGISSYDVLRAGRMTGTEDEDVSGLFSFYLYRDSTYSLFRDKGDYFGASFGTVDACNADLEPSAVPNGFITSANVVDYVSIVAKATGGNFLGAAADLVNLTQPTTQGFRFPDKKSLFTFLSQLPAVDLAPFLVDSSLGDIGIYLNPGFSPVGASYSMSVIGFGKLTKFVNQVTAPACRYLPGVTNQFPSSGATCASEIAAFIAASPNFRFSSKAACDAAVIAGTAFGGACLLGSIPCVIDPSVTNYFWYPDQN